MSVSTCGGYILCCHTYTKDSLVIQKFVMDARFACCSLNTLLQGLHLFITTNLLGFKDILAWPMKLERAVHALAFRTFTIFWLIRQIRISRLSRRNSFVEWEQ